MTKQTKSSPKPPADPVESAIAMLDKLEGRVNAAPGSTKFDRTEKMLRTVLMVRAIDRLTAAVKDNTKAVRQG